ncbi:MAG TPA: HlyC/CorC family transporter [Lachnospiraceae bacterium]|nr:HlyC/CorC family transporter [Lachnospiraceae bacterium]
MDDGQLVLRIILFIILILISAILFSTNIAVSALSESRLEKQSEEGSRRAAKILRYAKEPFRYRSALYIMELITAVTSGIFLVRPLAVLLGQTLAEKGMPAAFSYVLSLILLCLADVLVITVFAVNLPKRAAMHNPERLAFASINFVSMITGLFMPMTLLAGAVTKLAARLEGPNSKDIEENVTEEDIIMMVSEGHEQGVIEESEAEMISNIFELDDKQAADIMTHRSNVCGIESDCPLREAAQLMSGNQFSRYPVYEDDLDNIIGILHLKDVMRALLDGKPHTIKDIMRPPVFVPETQNIDKLFRTMQADKMHLVIVVDEYGQTSGILAMEDILEEIVGNIMDEYDVDENHITPTGNKNEYIIDGRTPLDELGKRFGITFDDDRFETLNGFMMSCMDRVPEPDDHFSCEYKGYRFRILSVENRQVQRVLMTRL